ncbi:glycosyltransferase [Flavobacteriaceae bacterium AU392]|nr:glycosyltransferase [Flavobacteriaceae bacterium]RKM81182.1 glycosyltransferase [Flavobacteriaceae bacterium AU392]
MSESPLVTVICLSYNHEKYVIEALNSISKQNYDAIEIIIVDDASTDNTASLIKKWTINNSAIFIQNKNNLGNTKSFNNALKLAKGNFIVDFAADDILLPDFIKSGVETFASSSHKNLGVVFSNLEFINDQGGHIKYMYPITKTGHAKKKPYTGNVYKHLLYGYFISAPSMLIKKDVFNKLEGYDENLLYEDLDFWFRSSRLFNYDYTDKVLVKKRILKNSLSSNFYKKSGVSLEKSTYISCQKAFKLNKNSEEYKALINRIGYELRLAIKNKNAIALFQFLYLLLKIKSKIIFK